MPSPVSPKELATKVRKRLFPGDYNPTAYWNKRPDPNNLEGNEAGRVTFDTAYIAAAIGDDRPVLELGPGVGRTLGVYRPGDSVTALDLSRNYADRLAVRAAEIGIELEQVFLDSPDTRFPFDDQSFPVGVASQVLLHVPPTNIRHTMSELVRVCERTVVVSMSRHHQPLTRRTLSHVFNHDYVALATELGCQLDGVITNSDRLLFTPRRSTS